MAPETSSDDAGGKAGARVTADQLPTLGMPPRDTSAADQPTIATGSVPPGSGFAERGVPLVGTGDPGSGRDARDRGSQCIGDYELLEEIARGGMGVVYRARHRSLQRIVALKMILSGRFASSEDLARFFAEAEAAARLDHPGIVPVYEIGQADGQHFFSMKFIDGGSLASQMAALRPDPRRGMALLAKVARAVHHAHQRGILHRDLKPANILLDAQGEPLVSDLGLAKRVDTDSQLTRTGAIVGTPAYMSPEQALGTKEVTTATDVYALGAILYELLTGRPPYTGSSPMEVILQVVKDPPPQARQVDASIDRELDLICRKCLEREPNQRYSSAAALADDLDAWLAGQPVSVSPPSTLSLAAHWMKNNLRSALGSAVIGIAVGVALGLMFLAGPVTYELGDIGTVYRAFPHEKPVAAVLLERLLVIPPGVRHLLPIAGTSLLAMVGLFNVIVVRPRSRDTAIATGSIAGLLAAVTSYLLSIGWGPIVETSARAAEQDVRLLAEELWSDSPAQRQHLQSAVLRRYPDLAARPVAERARLLSNKILYDQILGIPVGLWTGLLVTLLWALVPVVVGSLWASAQQLRYHDLGRTIGRYFEVMPMFTVVFTFVVMSLTGLMVCPSWPYQLAFYGPGSGAVLFGMRATRWSLRAACHVAWWIAMVLFLREGGRTANALALAQQAVPQGQHAQAAFYLERFLERHPSNHLARFQTAVLRLHQGDEAAYQRHCGRLLASYADNMYAATAADQIAKSCLLTPRSKDELPALAELAEFAAADEQDPLVHWFYLGRCLLAYRQHDPPGVGKWAARAREGNQEPWIDATTLLLEAMSAGEQGNSSRAAELATQADQARPASAGRDAPEPLWANRLFFEILRKEVTPLIETH